MTDIRSLQSVRDNVLSIAAHRFIGNHLHSKPLARSARANPGIEIIANIGPLDQAIEKIRHRDVDLGLFLAQGEARGINSEILGRQRLVFLAAPDHPLASRKRLGYRDLADHPFIGPVRGTEYARLLRRIFEAVGFANHNTITQSQNTLIRRELILSGIGFSCALETGWKDDLADGLLVILDVAGNSLSLEVRVGSLPDRKFRKASRKFLAYLDIFKAERAFDS